MKVDARFINADNLEVTLTVTMTLRDWKSLKESLPVKYPAWKLSEAISRVVYKLERQVTDEEVAP
jgi:hypothetical protein